MHDDYQDMPEDGTRFTAVDDEGNQRECYALFTFESPQTGRNYIVYTDYSTDQNGDTKVFASILNQSDDADDEGAETVKLDLCPIETDEEWELIQDILDELQKEIDETDGEFFSSEDLYFD